jgi:dTDP-4-dehydrorhamnose reductase
MRLVHVSTDFVFDGSKPGAYTETDEPSPLSVYGASKLAGERAVLAAHPDVLMVRTAWVFGPGGVNFPYKILSAARERGALTVVDDEIGSPTYSVDLATGIVALVEAGVAPGIYHLAGSGSVSRYDLALEVLGAAGVEVPVGRASSAQFPTRAARPRNSVLDCSKAAEQGVRLPRWEDGVRRFIRAERGER